MKSQAFNFWAVVVAFVLMIIFDLAYMFNWAGVNGWIYKGNYSIGEMLCQLGTWLFCFALALVFKRSTDKIWYTRWFTTLILELLIITIIATIFINPFQINWNKIHLMCGSGVAYLIVFVIHKKYPAFRRFKLFK